MKIKGKVGIHAYYKKPNNEAHVDTHSMLDDDFLPSCYKI
jgi:hypothetical protein